MTRRDPAAARWAAIQLARAGAVACALAGIAVLARRTEAVAGVPLWAGAVLLAAGLFALFVVPVSLARRWRSPPP